MGKSWKFMTSSKDRPKSPKSHADYQWSTQAFTLKEIVSSFKLPTIVLCNVESCTVLWSNFYFELKQPLLLYSRRHVKKACAWCLRKNHESGRYAQFGPPVVIPEDYDGWFQLIHGENDRPFQFNSIESVASSLTNNFLCATESQAFLVRFKADGTLQFTQRTIVAGEVLRKVGVYAGEVAKPKENQSDETELMEMKYLKCIDEKGDELVIPFVQKGKFYAITHNISYNSGLVQAREIVKEGCKLPVFAQHVYGDPPALSYNYTGQLQFYDFMQEETIMAATLTKDRVRPLELQMDSVVRFRIALNEAQIRPRSEFIKALELCQGMGQKYVRDMKIAFTLSPATTSLDDIDLSLYTTNERSLRQSSSLEMESDLGEAIDANSEFEVDWGSSYSCENSNKQDDVQIMGDSHVRYDEVGYYVENIKEVLGEDDAGLSDDDELTTDNNNTMIINHGRISDTHIHQSGDNDILSDGTDDTDIFYDDEYLENRIALDKDEDEQSCDTIQVVPNNESNGQSSHTNGFQISDSQQFITEPEISPNKMKDDVYDVGQTFIDQRDVFTANEDMESDTRQHRVPVHRDDTGYESDPIKNTDQYVEETFFIYETGADNIDSNEKDPIASPDNDVSSNKELYDSIEVGGLSIVEGSVFSDKTMTHLQYDWGDEFV